jgi:DNA gyrase/topoisomerase IV subunit A
MITPEKIEEWLREVEQRPESAPLIIQFIANRLRDLSVWNESLRAENIALMSGNRVEEYERRIAHLEYELDLLRRQFGDVASQMEGSGAQRPAPVQMIHLLVYDGLGHLMRLELNPSMLQDGAVIGRLGGEIVQNGEPLRLLAVSASEELLFVFTYGRVVTRAVEDLPLFAPGESLDWAQAPVPEARRSKELLACVTPIARLALADYFIQVSRRGFVKKVLTSMASSILSQQYIGIGTTLPVDRIFETLLCRKENRVVLVSHEGYLQCLDAGELPFSIEEAMRLGATDHLVAALVSGADKTIIVMTQIGKVVALEDLDLETAESLKLKGQALFSGQRRASGVRVVGARAVSDKDWALALHSDGQITLQAVSTLLGRGSLPVQGELLAFTTFTV